MLMSDYKKIKRNRKRTLLIVEGNHEKNVLFYLIFKCFPELNINKDDVWIYSTNIYQLYNNIIEEYGVECFDQNDDIDLPFVVSKKLKLSPICRKKDFTNILLVFDYERQDPEFSEHKIMQMQKTFYDMAEMGMLYINYPMIESYRHINAWKDEEYVERKYRASLKRGSEYKNLVKQESILSFIFDFAKRIDDLLHEHYGIEKDMVRAEYVDYILSAKSDEELLECIEKQILVGPVENRHALKGQIIDWVHRVGYLQYSQTYYERLRDIFIQIIRYNITKSVYIQSGGTKRINENYREAYNQINYEKLLAIQNETSRNAREGFIWVLNTCVFIVAEYKFGIIEDQIKDNR